MTWTVMEVDPGCCPSRRRESPGTGYLRTVNLSRRPHPGAARAFHCADCGRHIGKTSGHWLFRGDDRVFCSSCYVAGM